MVRRTVLPLLLAALASGAAAAPASAALPAFAAGVTVDTLDKAYPMDAWARQLDQAKAAGVRIVRTEVSWSDYEPTPGAQDPTFLATVDNATTLARDRGMKLVVVVQSTPCWATTAPDGVKGDCSTKQQRDRAGAYPPREAAPFGDFVAAMAARYQRDWAAVEIWNEPDGAGEFYFGGPDKPRRYAELMKDVYPKVQAAAPSVDVLGGSLVGANGAFLRELYKHGFKGTYDALSVHFYDLVLASLRAIRQVQTANGDKKPLVLGEFGWSSCYPKSRLSQGGQACVRSADQGKFIVDVLAAMRRASYLKGAIIYKLNDSSDLQFGLTTVTGRAKPSMRTVAAALKGTPKPRRTTLRLRRRGGHVVASGSGPGADKYELNVFQGGALRYRAEFRLDRFGRYALRLPRQLGTSGLRVTVKQYWLNKTTSRRI